MCEVLFVGENEQHGVLQLAGCEDAMELDARLVNPIAVLTVDDEY